MIDANDSDANLNVEMSAVNDDIHYNTKLLVRRSRGGQGLMADISPKSRKWGDLRSFLVFVICFGGQLVAVAV